MTEQELIFNKTIETYLGHSFVNEDLPSILQDIFNENYQILSENIGDLARIYSEKIEECTGNLQGLTPYIFDLLIHKLTFQIGSVSQEDLIEAGIIGLNDLKQLKIIEITNAFNIDIATGFTYNGITLGLYENDLTAFTQYLVGLNNLENLSMITNESDVTIADINNTIQTLTFGNLKVLLAHYTLGYKEIWDKKLLKLTSINEAESIEELNLISWNDA
jgi:hypothetical protein